MMISVSDVAEIQFVRWMLLSLLYVVDNWKSHDEAINSGHLWDTIRPIGGS